MKNQEIVNLFEFVAKEVERLEALGKTDWQRAAQEIGLHTGLPCNYDDFCKESYICGEVAGQKLYEMAVKSFQANPKLKGRAKVQTYLKSIMVEFAQRGLAKREKIDETLVKVVLREAESWTVKRFEDRMYFFPVYTLDVEGGEEYRFGPVRFIRSEKFFQDNEPKLKSSEESKVMGPKDSQTAREIESCKPFTKSLFDRAREHYGAYKWIACTEVKAAEPSVGWRKARAVVEQSFCLLRLAVHSREGSFIGFIDENPTPRTASYMSLKSNNEFDVWHSTSYAQPHVKPEFILDYRRKVPQLADLEFIVEKSQRWEQPNAIEDRMWTAMFWFNEAWKEVELLPKIVKFSTCLECLFSTSKDHEAITETISERLAWLSFPEDQAWQKRRDTYRTMKRVYGVRSKAVHGDSAVKGFDLPVLAREAEEQAVLGVFAVAQLLPLFREKKNEDALLHELFVRLKMEGLLRAQAVFEDDSTAPTGLG